MGAVAHVTVCSATETASEDVIEQSVDLHITDSDLERSNDEIPRSLSLSTIQCSWIRKQWPY